MASETNICFNVRWVENRFVYRPGGVWVNSRQRAEVSDALSRVNKQHLTADSTQPPPPTTAHVMLSIGKAHLPDSINKLHRGKGDQ